MSSAHPPLSWPPARSPPCSRPPGGLTAATVTPLASERDLNLLVGSRYVLKISNPAEDPAVVDMENTAMAHALRTSPDLPIPHGGPGNLRDHRRASPRRRRPHVPGPADHRPARASRGRHAHHHRARRAGRVPCAARTSLALQGLFHPRGRPRPRLGRAPRARGPRAVPACWTASATRARCSAGLRAADSRRRGDRARSRRAPPRRRHADQRAGRRRHASPGSSTSATCTTRRTSATSRSPSPRSCATPPAEQPHGAVGARRPRRCWATSGTARSAPPRSRCSATWSSPGSG